MQIIPLDCSPNQTFQITLSVNTLNISLKFFLSYNGIAGYWTMRVTDPQSGTVMLDSIPLIVCSTPTVPVNFIWQYDYLKIGSAYLIKVGTSGGDYPDDTNLGTDFVLVWGDNLEYHTAQTVEQAVALQTSLSTGGVTTPIVQLVGKIGETGPAGPGYLANSFSSNTIGLGLKTFVTLQTILAYQSGTVCRAYYNSTNYMEGTVVSFSNNNLIIDVTRIVGSGTHLNWYFSVAADISDVVNYASAAQASAIQAALQAASLVATSTTSLLISLGSKSFVTQSNKQFAAGQFVLAVSNALTTNYMHGQIISYGGTPTTLVVNVLDFGGSGTYADWNISVSGSQGAVGPSGIGLISNGVGVYAGSASLTNADLGRACYYSSASAGTLTLPVVAGCSVGQIISVYNLGTSNGLGGVCTVKGAGSPSESISAQGLYSVSSIVLKQGDCIQLLANTSNWVESVGSVGKGIPTAIATTSGSPVSAITATYSPPIQLVDKLIVNFVSDTSNLTTAPTFNPNGLGAVTITKQGGQALAIGDIPALGGGCLLQYYATSPAKWELLNPAAGSGGGGATKTITQSSHGFVVGNTLYVSGSPLTYSKTKADNVLTAESVGIVSSVISSSMFVLLNVGWVGSLSGLTAGTVYFLSDSVAGALTATEPTTEGYISKPCFIADSTTSGYFFNMRGAVIGGGASCYTTTFTSANLTAGVLTVTHNFGHQYCSAPTIINNSGLVVQPDEITYTSTTQLTVDLSSYGAIAGTWRVIVLDTGASLYSNFATAAEITAGTESAKAIAPDQLKLSSPTFNHIHLSTGSVVIDTAGQGIDFSADSSAAGMTSELLDDYEEGTWTPTVGGDATYGATNGGTYTKIGRLVIAEGRIAITLIGTGSTTALTGLPFTRAASSPEGNANVQYFYGLAANVYWLSGAVVSSGTSIYFHGQTALDGSLTGNMAVFGNSAMVDFTAVYFT